MKRTFLIITTLLLSFMLFSCSRCYECVKENEIINNGVVVETTTTVDNVCTATGKEIEDREANGYVCSTE